MIPPRLTPLPGLPAASHPRSSNPKVTVSGDGGPDPWSRRTRAPWEGVSLQRRLCYGDTARVAVCAGTTSPADPLASGSLLQTLRSAPLLQRRRLRCQQSRTGAGGPGAVCIPVPSHGARTVAMWTQIAGGGCGLNPPPEHLQRGHLSQSAGVPTPRALLGVGILLRWGSCSRVGLLLGVGAVSYTHLTLPTTGS